MFNCSVSERAGGAISAGPGFHSFVIVLYVELMLTKGLMGTGEWLPHSPDQEMEGRQVGAAEPTVLPD